MVAAGTLDDLRRSATRRVTVMFRQPAGAPPPDLPGVTLRSRTDTQWVLDVQGPLGPIVQALAPFPVHDIEVEAFKLEDYVTRFYAEA